MKNKKRIVIIGIIIGIIVILFWENEKSGIRGIDIGTVYGTEVIEGVNDTLPTHCVTEKGVIYAKNQRIYFLDYETSKEHILCDDVGCVHFSTDCGAFYNNYCIEGLAVYQGSVYHVDLSVDGKKYQLIRTDSSGNNKEVVTEVTIGSYGEGEWYLQQVNNVYYGYGYAYAELTYLYLCEDGEEITTTQCIAIKLKNGKIAELTEREAKNITYHIVNISKNSIVLRGEQVEDVENMIGKEMYFVYDFSEMRLKKKEENQITTYQTEYATNAVPTYDFLGVYCDNLVGEYFAERYLSENQTARLFLWDIGKNEKQPLVEIENCTPIMFGEGNYHQYVYDDKYILCSEKKQDGKIEIVRLNLETGKVEKLFEDTENITFRIVGQTSNSFIGKIYEFPDEEKMSVLLYQISKEDYYNNNFSAMRLIQQLEY